MSKLLCLCVTSLVCDRKLDGVCVLVWVDVRVCMPAKPEVCSQSALLSPCLVNSFAHSQRQRDLLPCIRYTLIDHILTQLEKNAEKKIERFLVFFNPDIPVRLTSYNWKKFNFITR